MHEPPVLIDIDRSNLHSLPCCGIKNPTHPGVIAKRGWIEKHLRLGLKARVLVDDDGKPCGYIEYLPGEYAWRAVDAQGYMFIHCIWNHSRRNRDKGWGSAMVRGCLHDAKVAGMKGVAVVTRESPWSAGAALFDANRFKLVDVEPPDYQLWVRKFDSRAADPHFRDCSERLAGVQDKLAIVTSAQCPYAVKFASEIHDVAREVWSLDAHVIELHTHREAQQAPTPFAVFSVVSTGRVLADHPISCTRFCNIMRAEGDRRIPPQRSR